MKTATCSSHYEAILSFLRSDANLSHALIHIADKLKCCHLSYSRTKMVVDNLSDIGVVVALLKDVPNMRSNVSYIAIECKDIAKLKDFLHQHSDVLFPAGTQVGIQCCRSSLLEEVKQLLTNHHQVYAVPAFLYFRSSSDNLAPRTPCPPGYKYRSAITKDAYYIYSTWKFARGDMTPVLAEQYGNLFRNLASVVVTTEENGEEVVVGCCMQSTLGSLSKLFVDEKHRRRGLAAFMVDEMVLQIGANGDAFPPHAHIEPENKESISLFEKLGFKKHEEGESLVWAMIEENQTS